MDFKTNLAVAGTALVLSVNADAQTNSPPVTPVVPFNASPLSQTNLPNSTEAYSVQAVNLGSEQSPRPFVAFPLNAKSNESFRIALGTNYVVIPGTNIVLNQRLVPEEMTVGKFTGRKLTVSPQPNAPSLILANVYHDPKSRGLAVNTTAVQRLADVIYDSAVFPRTNVSGLVQTRNLQADREGAKIVRMGTNDLYAFPVSSGALGSNSLETALMPVVGSEPVTLINHEGSNTVVRFGYHGPLYMGVQATKFKDAPKTIAPPKKPYTSKPIKPVQILPGRK